MDSCRIAGTAESADRMAHMPSEQALISLVEASAVHSDRTDMSMSETANLCHLAKPELAAV